MKVEVSFPELNKKIKLLLFVFMILGLCYNLLGVGTDDTDKDGWHRSGFHLLIDYKTGKQYLSDGHGGLIERQLK